MGILSVYMRVFKTSLCADLMRKRNIREGYDGEREHFLLTYVSRINLRSRECHSLRSRLGGSAGGPCVGGVVIAFCGGPDVGRLNI